MSYTQPESEFIKGTTKTIEQLKDTYKEAASDEERAFIVFQIAENYRNAENYYSAEKYYEKAKLAGFINPIIDFHYAEVLSKNGKINEAIQSYNAFLKTFPNDSLTMVRVNECNNLLEWTSNPTRYKVKNMLAMNSTEGDFSPAYMKKDYSIVYFASNREEATGRTNKFSGLDFSDIFYVVKDRKGKWSFPSLVAGEELNTSQDEWSPASSFSYKFMYFTRCYVKKNEIYNCDICAAERRGFSWYNIEVLELFADSLNAGVGYPVVSKDNHTLYFVSNHRDGYGGSDIWFAKREHKDSAWSKPQNMGPDINTPGDEISPYIAFDGTFYFSSNGHDGMGGHDIYSAVRNADGTWNINNLQYPLNSAYNDFGIIMEKDNSKGFLTSDRTGGKGAEDIYSFEWPPLNIQMQFLVNDSESGDPLHDGEFRLFVQDQPVPLIYDTIYGNVIKIRLAEQSDYSLVCSNDKYFTDTLKFSTNAVDSDTLLKFYIEMNRIVKEEEELVVDTIVEEDIELQAAAEVEKEIVQLVPPKVEKIYPPLLHNKISIQANNKKLKDVLDEIGRKAGVRFSYSSSIVNPNRLVSVWAGNEPIYSVLERLINDQNISYKVLNNMIIIYK
jgi:peptidoglycan-associated lipoprotein